MTAPWRRALVSGRESFLLSSDTVDLAMTVGGAHLGPVTFFRDEPSRVSPYAVAPWALETIPTGTAPVLANLRGDWFCSAFGANSGDGFDLPLHGETANNDWHCVEGAETPAGSWLRLAVDLPVQGGRCESLTALLPGQSVIYQRHDLHELTAALNPGHHATLKCPAAGRLSFSRFGHAQTYIEPTERAASFGTSCFQPDAVFDDLSRVPCMDGTTTDISRYPARRGYEDIAIVCADPATAVAWSAATFQQQGYVWFALRDPRVLASTLLWFSNGGRRYPPWNGRHVDVVGIEDITAFFHVGRAASCSANLLTRRGVRTCLEPSRDGTLRVAYIQGVARIPDGFNRLVSVMPEYGRNSLCLLGEGGTSVTIGCDVDFLRTGQLVGAGIA